MTDADLTTDSAGSIGSPGAPGSAWQDHAAALVTALAVGAAAGALILWLSGKAGGTGDEPPIRVKNGSMELHLLSNSRVWRKNGDSKNWKISGGTRANEDFQVFVSSNSGATCSGQSASGSSVRITYQEGNVSTSVELKATGNHTKLTSTADLSLSADKRILSYAGDGYISAIDVGGTNLCTFADKNQLKDMVMLDY